MFYQGSIHNANTAQRKHWRALGAEACGVSRHLSSCIRFSEANSSACDGTSGAKVSSVAFIPCGSRTSVT